MDYNFTKKELQMILYMISDWESAERHFTEFLEIKNKLYEILEGDTDIQLDIKIR